VSVCDDNTSGSRSSRNSSSLKARTKKTKYFEVQILNVVEYSATLSRVIVVEKVLDLRFKLLTILGAIYFNNRSFTCRILSITG
jgi:hypothetical protein